MEHGQELAEEYREFAAQAADSATFTAWSAAVADDAEVLDWLATLPRAKQQPNLVLAAARLHGVPAPGPYAALREALLADGSDGPIRATVLERSTQTNEVGRLATLAPAFAIVAAQHDDAPLSLLEVGASAGLCLYPDRYTYRWRTEGGDVVVGAGPGLACDVTGPAPLPQRVPRVAARRGIDLNPLDVTSPDDVAWLETLVWPEHDDRRARLRAALEVARADPPHVVAGDLLTELPRLVEEAAADGPVVVLHSAGEQRVLTCAPVDHRDRLLPRSRAPRLRAGPGRAGRRLGPRARTHAALARLTHLPPPDLETSLGSRTPLRSCP